MPMPPLLLGADARSIQLFSSCLGAGATGGFLRRTACPVAGTERCAAGGRARAFLAEAASAQAHSVVTAKSSAIAGERTMRTSTVSPRAPLKPSGAIGRSRHRPFEFPSQRPQIVGNPAGQSLAQRPGSRDVDADTEQRLQFELQPRQIVQRRSFGRFDQEIEIAAVKIVSTSNRAENLNITDGIPGYNRPNTIRILLKSNRRTHCPIFS